MNRYERTIAELRARLRARSCAWSIDPLIYRASLRYACDGDTSLTWTRFVVVKPSALVRKHLQEPVRLP